MPAASGGSYGADALEGLGRNSKVWIAVAAPGDDDAADMYRPATVISLGADTAEVRLNDELEVSVPLAEVFPANPDILEGAEDLTQLSYLNEPSILHDLHHRYSVDDIYTRAGPVLIAVNPFKSLPALYAPDVVAAYRAGTAQKPHVYRVASAAYDEMIRHRKNQAVIISGESGAGKTETTKIAMGFLASVGGGGAGVESRVLQTNPILEAFGNAKTLRNDNSSRFGKLIDIGFDRGGVITGASVQTYLLEKSRVTSQSEGERGYHVFYQLCAGATEAERAAFRILPNVTDYAYLSNSSCAKIAGVDDASSYRELKAALLGVGTSEADVRDIFRVVAAVMWLGNVTFVEEAVDGEDNAARVAPGKGAEALEIASDLLGVSSERLESSFVTRKLRAGGESVTQRLNAVAAADGRDALAKAVYAALFDWLVARINASFANTRGAALTTISILDIYGFEFFERNSFEQLCINYANERLQQQFNRHLFKLEQEEYEREKIDWTKVEFEDNQACLDLIERRPMGVLSLLDEQCASPKATDATFAQKMATELRSDPRYARDKRDELVFHVQHYAGEVNYDATGFLDKNRDALHQDLLAALSESTEPAVSALAAAMSESRDGDVSRAGGLRARAKTGRESVGARFKGQLASLVAKLDECSPHFVRCIKPNGALAPAAFEQGDVLRQLRCCGVLEVVRISRQGYPSRYDTRAFAERFGFLLPPTAARSYGDDPERFCRAILKRFRVAEEAYQFGVSKVFLRAGQIGQMEDNRTRKLDAVERIQRVYRGAVARAAYRRERAAIILSQASARAALERRKYLETLGRHRAAVVAQRIFRGFSARKTYAADRAAVIAAQMAARRWMLRRRRARAAAAREAAESARRAEEAEREASRAAANARAAREAARVRERRAKAEAEARKMDAETRRAEAAEAEARKMDAETRRAEAAEAKAREAAAEAEAKAREAATRAEAKAREAAAEAEAQAREAIARAEAQARDAMTRASAAEAETARLRAALSEKTAECESRGRRLIEAEGEWSEEMSALRAALSAVRAALESGKPPPAEIVAAVARSPAASGAPSPGTPPLATHAGAKRSDADAAAAAASEKKRRSRAEGMEHVSALSKELDTRARVFEDDADFIVEVREGSSDADLDPDFELKNLGLRFENWKRDFKDRLRETRLMLKRLDKLENGIGGDDAFDDAYAYGYREDDAYPSREDAYGDEEEEENDYERVDARDRGKEPKKRRWGLKRVLGLKR